MLKQPYAKSVVSVCQKMLIKFNEKLEEELVLETLFNEQSINSVQTHKNGNNKVKSVF